MTNQRSNRKTRRKKTHTFPEERLHGCSKEIRYIKKKSCWLVFSHHVIDRTDTNGYIRIHRNSKSVALHRYIWEKVNKRHLRRNEMVQMACGNPACINPKHMVLGKRYGWIARGRRKLTMAQAEKIRDLHFEGETQVSLAIKYNVCQGTIHNIIKGKTYRLSEWAAELPQAA